eukprot:scpid84873/ scgid1579/ 
MNVAEISGEEKSAVLCCLFLLAHDEGDLDDEELLMLIGGVELCAARGLLVGPQEIGIRLDFNLLDDDVCLRQFRFTHRQLEELFIALQVPHRFRAPCRTTWNGMEGLLILLRRLAYPDRLGMLCEEFGRSKPVLSLIINSMLMWIWERWGGLLENPFAQPYFTQGRIQAYVRAISAKVGVHLNVWGYIDGTVRPICRPGMHQRVMYNGHKRVHAVKYQAVAAPDGLITHLHGPHEGRRHDAGILRESRLLDDMAAQINHPENAPPFALYGDPAYPLNPYLQKAYRGANLPPQQHQFNAQMNAGRIAVEWAFGDVATLWAYLDMKKQQKLLLQPVGLFYRVAVLFTNLRTIMRYGNKTSSFFGISPPSLEEYLQP